MGRRDNTRKRNGDKSRTVLDAYDGRHRKIKARNRQGRRRRSEWVGMSFML